ncbi:MAG TPA: ComEA family DNA-binding protein [Micromonosporaceae bacterium]
MRHDDRVVDPDARRRLVDVLADLNGASAERLSEPRASSAPPTEAVQVDAASWAAEPEPARPLDGTGRDAPAPTPLRSALGAFDPGRRGVRALALVAAVVVLGAALLAWRAGPHVEPVAATRTSTVSATASPSGASVVVAVAGRVRHPGLVRLPAGARVADALEAAGGALPGTDLSFLNLARKLTDGELIVVGVTPPPEAAGEAGGASTAGLVNLNTATSAQLDSLPGIGPALAQRILDYRREHGPFNSVDDLRHVEGIGDAKFAQIKDRVTV